MPAARTDLRQLLPREHGAWSLALEPVALGLLAAPSAASTAIALVAIALFLARRPAQLVRKGDSAKRVAALVLDGLLLVAVVALFVAAQLASWRALWPLLLALPPAVAFLVFDARGDSRAAAAELAGAAAFAFVPAACATAAGRPWSEALALAALVLARILPAVLTIRTFLRRRKGAHDSPVPALVAGSLAVGAATVLAIAGLASGAVLGLMLLWFLRTVWLLGPVEPDLRATRLGLLESALGLAFVLAAGLT